MQEEDGPARRGAPSRRHLVAVMVPIVALIICSNIGDALTTSWAEEHPLALILLNSRNRILVLTTNQLDAFSFYVVGSLRNLVADPLFFLLGVWYGDGAIRWLEERSPTYGEIARKVEQGFGKAAYPLVLLAPNQWICLLAGAAGMSVPIFLVLNLLGTAGRMVLIRELGQQFESPIDSVLGFFSEYRLPLFIASIVLVLLSVVVQRRTGGGELGAIRDLDREANDDG